VYKYSSLFGKLADVVAMYLGELAYWLHCLCQQIILSFHFLQRGLA